jgi:hypothetical protein
MRNMEDKFIYIANTWKYIHGNKIIIHKVYAINL